MCEADSNSRGLAVFRANPINPKIVSSRYRSKQYSKTTAPNIITVVNIYRTWCAHSAGRRRTTHGRGQQRLLLLLRLHRSQLLRGRSLRRGILLSAAAARCGGGRGCCNYYLYGKTRRRKINKRVRQLIRVMRVTRTTLF